MGETQGKHSHIGYDAPKGLDENKAKLRLGDGPDPRKSTAEMQVYTWEQVNTNTTKTWWTRRFDWSTSCRRERRRTKC